MEPPKDKLGRGLEDLMQEAASVRAVPPPGEAGYQPVKLSALEVERPLPSPDRALTESIRRHGVLQPVLVQARGEHFVLVTGAQRVAAAMELELETIPARILPAGSDDQEALHSASNLGRPTSTPSTKSEWMMISIVAALIVGLLGGYATGRYVGTPASPAPESAPIIMHIQPAGMDIPDPTPPPPNPPPVRLRTGPPRWHLESP